MSWARGMLHTWGPYVLVVGLQVILFYAFTAAHRLVTRWLDRVHPDDLPSTTATWLREQLAMRGLESEIRVLLAPSKGGVDAYWPSARAITLGLETYCKNDPSFWAIGAHELGHALVHRSSRALEVLFALGRVGGKATASLSTMLLFANILLKSPAVTSAAFVLQVAAVVLGIIVCADEALASTLAWSMLRPDLRLGPRQRRAAILSLATAFLTYVGALAGQIVLLSLWRIVTRPLAATEATAEPLSRLAVGFSAALTVLLVIGGVLAPLARRARRWARWARLYDSMRSALILTVVALVWQQPFGTLFAFACVLALVAARDVVSALVSPLVILCAVAVGALVAPLIIVGRRLAAPYTKGEDSRAVQQARVQVQGEMQRAAIELQAEAARQARDPPWHVHAGRLASAVLHVPLLVLFWWYQIG